MRVRGGRDRGVASLSIWLVAALVDAGADLLCNEDGVAVSRAEAIVVPPTLQASRSLRIGGDPGRGARGHAAASEARIRAA
jgi:hypothetical protein